jgi:hypothetical protein
MTAATSEPDPIFALIDAAKLANAASKEATDRFIAMHAAADPARDEAHRKCLALCHIASDANDAVFNAKPCTRAGLAAHSFLRRYAAENSDTDFFFQAVVNAARLLDGPLVSRIGLSDRLAKILSGEE